MAPPGRRQLLPTIAMGSRAKGIELPSIAWLPMVTIAKWVKGKAGQDVRKVAQMKKSDKKLWTKRFCKRT